MFYMQPIKGVYLFAQQRLKNGRLTTLYQA